MTTCKVDADTTNQEPTPIRMLRPDGLTQAFRNKDQAVMAAVECLMNWQREGKVPALGPITTSLLAYDITRAVDAARLQQSVQEAARRRRPRPGGDAFRLAAGAVDG